MPATFGTEKKKRQKLNEDITGMQKAAEDLYEKAETTRKLTLVTQANCLSRRAKEKNAELAEVQKELDKKTKNLDKDKNQKTG